MQREVNRSKEMMSWMSWILWPTGRSAVNAECACSPHSSLLAGSRLRVPRSREPWRFSTGPRARISARDAASWPRSGPHTLWQPATRAQAETRQQRGCWLLAGGGRRASRRGREAARNRVRRRGGGGGWMIFRSSVCFLERQPGPVITAVRTVRSAEKQRV